MTIRFGIWNLQSVPQKGRKCRSESHIFQDFQPNPKYDSIVNGVELFRKVNCDSIIAVGGGSAMNVAKCIKVYANMIGNGNKGCGYPNAVSMDGFKNLDAELEAAKLRNEMSLIEVKCSIGVRKKLGRPTTTARENKKNFMEYVSCQ